jgi:hypothetical protein
MGGQRNVPPRRMSSGMTPSTLTPDFVQPAGLIPTGFDASHCQLSSPYEKPA